MSSRRVVEIELSGSLGSDDAQRPGARIEVDAPEGTTREEALDLLRVIVPRIADFWGVKPSRVRGAVIMVEQERKIIFAADVKS